MLRSITRRFQQKLEQKLDQARRGSGDSSQSNQSQSKFFYAYDPSDEEYLVDSEEDEQRAYRPRVFSAPERTLLAAVSVYAYSKHQRPP